MLCMCIVNVIPKLDPNMESKEMLQCEMWMAKGPTHDPVPIWRYPEEWEEVQKACWHATECGWVAHLHMQHGATHVRSAAMALGTAWFDDVHGAHSSDCTTGKRAIAQAQIAYAHQAPLHRAPV